VLFAVIWAWLLLGELPGPVQLLGGLLIVGGVVLVRVDELRGPPALQAPDGAGIPRAGAGKVPGPLDHANDVEPVP